MSDTLGDDSSVTSAARDGRQVDASYGQSMDNSRPKEDETPGCSEYGSGRTGK